MFPNYGFLNTLFEMRITHVWYSNMYIIYVLLFLLLLVILYSVHMSFAKFLQNNKKWNYPTSLYIGDTYGNRLMFSFLDYYSI